MSIKNIDDLNTKIKQSGGWLDCAMWLYNGWQLTIIGSFDLQEDLFVKAK